MSETIGQKIRRLRLEKGLTSTVLGQQIRMSPSYLLHVECGRNMPGFGMVADIARVLGVSLDYLAGFTEHENNPYVRRAA